MKRLTLAAALMLLCLTAAAETRWTIDSTTNTIVMDAAANAPHKDHIEMSGLKAAVVYYWSIDENGRYGCEYHHIFPLLRTIPNNTHGFFPYNHTTNVAGMIKADGKVPDFKAVKVELDGTLRVTETAQGLELSRVNFPSTTEQAVYELFYVKNISDKPVKLDVPDYKYTWESDPARGVNNENVIVYLGNANPKFFGGGGFQVRWKQLTLTTFFYGRYGQKVINGARINLENMRGKNNQSTAVLHRWRAEGDQTDIPRALYGMGYNYLGSDRFVEDASFLRLKTLSLSYNLPKKWLKSLGINKLNVFATGYDLFTWTSYKGQDPEVKMPSPTSLVKDSSTTPVSKRYAFGINLDF